MTELEVAESITIAAPRELVWKAISDPSRYPKWSPEAESITPLSRTNGPWRVGDRFKGTNKAWVHWTTTCTIVVNDELRNFGFDVNFGLFPVARWEFTLADAPGSLTQVTQRWTDHRTGVLGAPTRGAGLLVGRGWNAAVHNRDGMRRTLQALKTDLESH